MAKTRASPGSFRRSPAGDLVARLVREQWPAFASTIRSQDPDAGVAGPERMTGVDVVGAGGRPDVMRPAG